MRLINLYSTLLVSFLLSGCSLLTYIENKVADHKADLAAQQREETILDLILDNNALLPRPRMTRWVSLSTRQKLKLLRESSFRLLNKKGQKDIKATLAKLAIVIEREAKKIDQTEQARGYRFTAAKLMAISESKEELLGAIATHKDNYSIKIEANFPHTDKKHIAAYVEAHTRLLQYLCEADV